MPVDPGEHPAFLLFRVDDRLLHGQVALGWGLRLRPRAYLIADERLAADEDAAGLYRAAAPEGTEVTVLAPGALLSGGMAARPGPAGTVLLVRGLAEAAFLLRGGVPGPVNIGGLHARLGAREVLPYVFLTADDVALLRALVREGYALYAQDLPQNPRREAREWLSGGEAGFAGTA
jgi:mannose/fructose/N-acetylgalactosamine-specific phosphotransferase system component IIB